MGTSTQELKHEAKLRDWSVRIQECRSSGMGVKAWCAARGIALKTYYNWERQIVKAATLHIAPHSGRVCGAKRPVCGFQTAAGAVFSGHICVS